MLRRHFIKNTALTTAGMMALTRQLRAAGDGLTDLFPKFHMFRKVIPRDGCAGKTTFSCFSEDEVYFYKTELKNIS